MKDDFTQVIDYKQEGRAIDLIFQKYGHEFSRRKLKIAIESNLLRVNGRIINQANFQLKKGMKLCFFFSQISLALKAPAQAKDSEIIADETDFLIINKPSGVNSESPELLEFCQKKVSSPLFLVHRLDKDTTGLLLFAKNPKSEACFLSLFKERHIHKTYYALCEGAPNKPDGELNNKLILQRSISGQKIYQVSQNDNGKQASTSWQTKAKNGQACLVACFPKTGRTHQIRVHLAYLKSPIIGDPLYGSHYKLKTTSTRCLLHAQALRWYSNGKEWSYYSKLPSDFLKLSKQLLSQKDYSANLSQKELGYLGL